MNKTILVFCAHPDDQIIGPGGTLAKYIQKGYVVKTFIFSKGEKSHPWLKEKHIANIRIKESEKADKIIGGHGVCFFNIEEGKFKIQSKEQNIEKKLKQIIKKEKPEKIFTHSINDPHPDHREVFNKTILALDSSKIKSELYSFRIWNIIDLKERNQPRLIVDITNYFSIKNKAISCFKSQKISLISLLWNFYALSFIQGLLNGFRMAEVFHRIR